MKSNSKNNIPPKDLSNFQSTVEIMKILRSTTGCPWDIKQTHESIASCAIEEVYEMVDAIEHKDEENFIEELGDVLLQVVFHSEIARQNKRFDISDVLKRLNTKLVTRHPHVFLDREAKTPEDALKSWSSMKAQEKSSSKKSSSGFNIPSHLPALQRADKIGKKTKRLKFDWENAKQAFTHVENEIQEFKVEMEAQDQKRMQDEFGDILFTLVQVARHLNIDAEQALRSTNHKVETRWIRMKEEARKSNLDFDQLNQNQLEDLWKKVKLLE